MRPPGSVDDLYDLDSDPYEVNNLKDHPDYTAVKQQLFDRLMAWITETDDPYPANVPKAAVLYST